MQQQTDAKESPYGTQTGALVACCGLDDRASEADECKDIALGHRAHVLCQLRKVNCEGCGSEAQPASCRMFFFWGQIGQSVKLTTRLYLVSRFRMNEILPPCPLYAFIA
jgi:hypothetical protein